MSALGLTAVTLSQGVDAALALVPSAAGVGQILAEGERNLVIGRASNLRRWAAGHLGRARAPKAAPGKLPRRPPTDLTPIAAAIAWVETTSPFGQRLAYERIMARHVPPAERRDLKRPAYLRLDPDRAFPRLVVQPSSAGGDVFGPFRDARAAARARDALYKHFRIRDCDFDFKPKHDLPAGLPAAMTRALDGGAGIAGLPPWVSRADGRSIVVERGRDGIELFPIAGGCVVDEAVRTVTLDRLDQSVGELAGIGAGPPRDDTPWLNAWRHGKHSGAEIRVRAGDDPAAVAFRVRQALDDTLASSK